MNALAEEKLLVSAFLPASGEMQVFAAGPFLKQLSFLSKAAILMTSYFAVSGDKFLNYQGFQVLPTFLQDQITVTRFLPPFFCLDQLSVGGLLSIVFRLINAKKLTLFYLILCLNAELSF